MIPQQGPGKHISRATIGSCSGRDGFALVAVIGAIGIIALLMVAYILAAHARVISAFNVSQRARAEALADYAVNSTIFELFSGLSRTGLATGRFGLSGIPVSCRMTDGSTITIAVYSESGKIDLNTATSDLIEAFLSGVMLSGQDVSGLALSILRAREAAGKNGEKPAFETTLQLKQIAGIDYRLLQLLSPLVTVHSKSPGVNARVTSPALLTALSASTSPAEAEQQNKTLFVADVLGYTVLIEGASATTSGVRFARAAIVEFSPGPPASFRIREWRDGFSTTALQLADGWPPC